MKLFRRRPVRSHRVAARVFAGAVLLLALAPPIAGARSIYVADIDKGSVSAISTATNQAEGTAIPVGLGPFAIAITPDGSRAYVANFFSENVSVIDTTTNQPVGTPIGVGRFPDAVAITPDGSRVYVANEGPGTVSVINTATNTVEGEAIPVGTEPDGIAITPDGSRAYVSTEGSKSVAVIDTATNALLGEPIKLGIFARAISVTPDGSRAYVVTGAKTVLAIDTTTTMVEGEPIAVGDEPVAIAITPDGSRAYVVNFSSSDISVIDTATNEVEEKTIEVGSKPRAIAISPDGSHAYVANEGSGTVSVIDTAHGRVEGEAIEVGSEPRAIAISPDQPALASFRVPRARPGVPLGLDASASTDADSRISSYAWDFGDQQATSLPGPSTVHTYARPGIYQVTLRVTDDEGCSTTLIFTGQTASCNGSAAVSQTQALKVAFPGVRVKCPRSAAQGCGFRLQAVTRKRRGRAESAVARAKAKPRGSAVVSLKPKKKFRSRLASARTILVKETVTIDGSRRVKFRRLKVVQ